MKINWKHKKKKLLQKFASISKKDLNFSIGKEKELLMRLKDRLGKTNEEILGIIIDL